MNSISNTNTWTTVEKKKSRTSTNSSHLQNTPFISGFKPTFNHSDKKDLTKTKLCRSAITGGICPHADRCRFAHSKEELKPPKCGFGDKCKNVWYEVREGKFVPGKWKNCNFIHEGETKDNYLERLRIQVKTPTKAPVQPTTPTEIETGTVLKIPKDMVLTTVEKMLESGETDIRVEII